MELPDWQKTGFAFVATPVDVAGALPVQLTPHHEFARAAEEEVQRIQDFLDKTPVAAEYPGAARQLYEQRPVIQQNSPTSRTVRYEPLEPAAYRYYVVHYRDGDHKVDGLQLTANVLRPPLDLSVRFHNKGFGIRSPDAFYRRQNPLYLPDPEIPIVRSEEIRAIGECYIRLEALETKYPEIKRAFLMLNELRDLPWRSDFEMLGLFAIVEILVTHRPGSSDTGDSITRQVSTKLPLLMNRFAPRIDPSQRFGQSKPATIWNKLYDYRSNLAHGSQPDFASKLNILGHADNVRAFLREITAALLRHSLVEPELMRDLQAC